MRTTTTTTLLGAAAATAALVLTGTSTAVAGQEDAATGGGQILVNEDGTGAGDTIAFTAKGTADSAKGQVQYVDRTGGTGQGQTVQHGTVTCVVVDGNVARISGDWRDGGEFSLYVQDNGEGMGAMDIVTLSPIGDPECDDTPEEDDQVGLARGNAQVRDQG